VSAYPNYPTCPRCEREVTDLKAEGAVEDRRFGRLDTTVMKSTVSFTLEPCGHEVAGFRADASGVREWHAERRPR
jgi:hypothetical protein